MRNSQLFSLIFGFLIKIYAKRGKFVKGRGRGKRRLRAREWNSWQESMRVSMAVQRIRKHSFALHRRKSERDRERDRQFSGESERKPRKERESIALVACLPKVLLPPFHKRSFEPHCQQQQQQQPFQGLDCNSLSKMADFLEFNDISSEIRGAMVNCLLFTQIFAK